MPNFKNPIAAFFLIISMVSMAGCATTKARKPDPAAEQNAQLTQMQQELQAKDQQIQDLQYQLQNNQSYSGTNVSSGSGSGKSSMIRVSGVSVSDVQKALTRAGYDPGAIDGRMGKKTKSAIKQFQRRNNLMADGVVGEKTWSKLR